MNNTQNNEPKKSSCNTHQKHDHVHGENCGHKAVKHDDHVDYEHDGHMHRMHDGHVDECGTGRAK